MAEDNPKNWKTTEVIQRPVAHFYRAHMKRDADGEVQGREHWQEISKSLEILFNIKISDKSLKANKVCIQIEQWVCDEPYPWSNSLTSQNLVYQWVKEHEEDDFDLQRERDMFHQLFPSLANQDQSGGDTASEKPKIKEPVLSQPTRSSPAVPDPKSEWFVLLFPPFRF